MPSSRTRSYTRTHSSDPCPPAPAQVYGGAEDVIEQTLTLFQDLASGYMSGKLLLKLDSISFLLTHHTAEYFPFLTGACVVFGYFCLLRLAAFVLSLARPSWCFPFLSVA